MSKTDTSCSPTACGRDRAGVDAALDEMGGNVQAVFSAAGVADGPGLMKINFIAHRHIAESLAGDSLLRALACEHIVDLGSGGGFPGLPLKIARPALSVVSVDSVAKKIAFQRHAARLFGLQGFSPLHLRAEALPELPGYAGSFDVVVSRAFAALPVFAALALPCLQPQVRIVAMKGAEGERELAEAGGELAELGLTCTEVRQLQLPASGARRSLLVLQRR